MPSSYNEGTLTVTNSTFSNNSASSSSGNSVGGGIVNFRTGTVIVTGSTFSGNSVSGKRFGLGGGIYNQGKLTVTNSTFSGNTASHDGGGIFIQSIVDPKAPGFIAQVDLTFSTIYGNTAHSGGDIEIEDFTIDSNGNIVGKATKQVSQVKIRNSIVAGDPAHPGPDISGALVSDGYNLIENVAGAKGLNASTDRQVKLADLKLDPTLRNNGGPTQTLALLPGSPAIDSVAGSACTITITDVSGHTETITTDQRGDPRPDGSEATCDSGAYESAY